MKDDTKSISDLGFALVSSLWIQNFMWIQTINLRKKEMLFPLILRATCPAPTPTTLYRYTFSTIILRFMVPITSKTPIKTN